VTTRNQTDLVDQFEEGDTMKQHMPGTHGEVDFGPLVITTLDLYPRLSGIPEAGPVMITRPDGVVTVVAPYTPSEVQAIITQGRKEPRRLSLAEERVRERNRAIERGDYAAAESSYSEQRDSEPGSRMLQRYPTGTRNYGHGPRRTAW